MRTSRVVALALFVGILFVGQEVLTDLASGKSISVIGDVKVVLVFWVVWAFLTPAVLAALRRWPLDTKPAYRPFLAHTVVATILAAVQAVFTVVLRSLMYYLRGGVSVTEASDCPPNRS